MEMVSGRVIPGCSNAGNPFHECTDICIERINAGDVVHKKEKKLFGFGKRTPSRDTPPSTPGRGSRSPLPSYFAKKKVESESSSPSNDFHNGNFLSRLSPLQGHKIESANSLDSLPGSPSLALYSGGDYFARRTDLRRDEDDDDDVSPRPFGPHPKTPEHPLRTPQHRPRTPQHRYAHQEDPSSVETRPRTPEHRYNTSDTRPRTPIHESAATGRRPQTPETRPRTPEHRSATSDTRPRTPIHESAAMGRRPQTSETRPRTPIHESAATGRRPQTSETRPRSPIPESAATGRRPQTSETRPRSPIHESAATGRRPQTSETRPRSPIHESAATGRRPQTSETRPRTPEHRSGTSNTRPGTPEHRYSTSDTRPRTPIHESAAIGRRPQTPETRPRTPEHRSVTSDTRPRTPIHESAATGRRPQTPETRPRTGEHRGRSPEIMARSPGPRSKTPEPQPTYFEPVSRTPKQRSKTPEPSPRIPQAQPISHRSLDSAALQTPQTVETRPRTPEHQRRNVERIHESRPNAAVYRGRSPVHREKVSQTQQTQAYNYLGSKAESVYIDKDDESVLLFPELLLSPHDGPPSRPYTPNRRSGYETPTKQEEHFDQLDDSASSDDDKFSFVDDQDEKSVWIYPEIAQNSPVHHESSRKSRMEQDKANNEPPELPDESQSFSIIEISRMKGIVTKKSETRDEMQSILSESYVSVGDYKVRVSVSATLQHILKKHGDIASASKLHSLATRSHYLDMLASVVFELQTTPLEYLRESRLVEMVAIVKDVESVKIKVDWLKPVLEEIVEAMKHYDEQKMSVMEKEVWERDVLLARQEMEKEVKELREKEKKVKEWKERMTEKAGKLGDVDMRRARLHKSFEFLSSKVDKFQGKPILQSIL